MAEVLHGDMNVQVRWVEARSRNTEENARLLRPLLEAHGVARIALVTHASHMTRASEMFRDQGFQVVAAPMGFSVGPPLPSEWWDWLPSASSFKRSYVAIHELVGRLWYRLRRD